MTDPDQPEGPRQRQSLRLWLMALAGIAFLSILFFLPRSSGFNPPAWKAWSGQPDDCSRWEMVGGTVGVLGMFARNRDAVIGLYGDPDRQQAATGGSCLGYGLGQCGPVAGADYELRICFHEDGRVRDGFVTQVDAEPIDRP